MATIRPFRGIRPPKELVEQVVSRPYDVLNSEEARAEAGDNDITDILGYRFMQSFKENGTGIRFGGRYLNQKLFTYANISYKNQGTPLKPGIGVAPSEDENAPLEQIVVPNYRG